MTLNRRNALSLMSAGLLMNSLSYAQNRGSQRRPNIILCMSDDQGWGDTGYNGHPVLKTPHLDQIEKEGIRFDRFYSGSAVCSPTRGSCLTGRHPFRYGIYGANTGHMKPEEITLAEVLNENGYTTGHFGKWHLGTLTKDINDGRRGGRQNEHYSPPWENGFDECFSTEQAVPTWDPSIDQRFETKFWTGPGEFAQDNLDGDASRVVMDRAIPFIEKSVQNDQPFFAVIWFHPPHELVIGGPEYRAMYQDQDENKQHYYGTITAMDEQIGRLRAELKQLGVADDTMLWFCSDNGPAGEGGGGKQYPGKRQQGTPGPFRGRKGSLYEGGVRVPSLLLWKNAFPEPKTVTAPCSTSDYFPTILDALDIEIPEQKSRFYDGVSMLPILKENKTERPNAIGFRHREQIAWNTNQYKIISQDEGKTYELYDLINDKSETKNLAGEKPETLKQLKDDLRLWRESCQNSDTGNDY